MKSFLIAAITIFLVSNVTLAEPFSSRAGFASAPSPEKSCAEAIRKVPGWREPLVDSAKCEVSTRFGKMVLSIFRPSDSETLEQFCSLSYRGEVTFNEFSLSIFGGRKAPGGRGFPMSISHTGEGVGIANDQALIFVHQNVRYFVNIQFGQVPSIKSISATIFIENMDDHKDKFSFSENKNCLTKPLSAL